MMQKQRYAVQKCAEEKGEHTWDVVDTSVDVAVSNHNTRREAREEARMRNKLTS
jgi:hypothetical protein